MHESQEKNTQSKKETSGIWVLLMFVGLISIIIALGISTPYFIIERVKILERSMKEKNE